MAHFLAFCRLVGLHPLSAFAMVAVDWMLFGGEATTLAVSWPVSVAVAFFLAIPCILVQRFAMKDHWGLAIGKGMIIGVLTAIPTSLPSILTFGGGVLGAAALIGGKKPPEIEQKK